MCLCAANLYVFSVSKTCINAHSLEQGFPNGGTRLKIKGYEDLWATEQLFNQNSFILELEMILGQHIGMSLRHLYCTSPYLSSIHKKTAEALYIGSLIQSRLGGLSSIFPFSLTSDS